MNPPKAPLLKMSPAARRLGVPLRQLLDLVDKGELPAHKYSSDILFELLELDAYALNHLGPGTPGKIEEL